LNEGLQSLPCVVETGGKRIFRGEAIGGQDHADPASICQPLGKAGVVFRPAQPVAAAVQHQQPCARSLAIGSHGERADPVDHLLGHGPHRLGQHPGLGGLGHHCAAFGQIGRRLAPLALSRNGDRLTHLGCSPGLRAATLAAVRCSANAIWQFDPVFESVFRENGSGRPEGCDRRVSPPRLTFQRIKANLKGEKLFAIEN